MRKLAVFAVSIFLILTGIFIDRYIISAQDAAADENDFIIAQTTKKTLKPGDWVTKIDNKTITLNEFEREFNVHVYSLPIDEKQKEELFIRSIKTDKKN